MQHAQGLKVALAQGLFSTGLTQEEKNAIDVIQTLARMQISYIVNHPVAEEGDTHVAATIVDLTEVETEDEEEKEKREIANAKVSAKVYSETVYTRYYKGKPAKCVYNYKGKKPKRPYEYDPKTQTRKKVTNPQKVGVGRKAKYTREKFDITNRRYIINTFPQIRKEKVRILYCPPDEECSYCTRYRKEVALGEDNWKKIKYATAHVCAYWKFARERRINCN